MSRFKLISRQIMLHCNKYNRLKACKFEDNYQLSA